MFLRGRTTEKRETYTPKSAIFSQNIPIELNYNILYYVKLISLNLFRK
jgi:ribosomal protein L30E